MLIINPHISIPDQEITFTTMRSSGPGGQHVNKVESAVQLRFDITTSSLPDLVKHRLLHIKDHRITSEGIVLIKVQESRSQQRNKAIALARLRDLVLKATVTPRKRRATRPSKESVKKRLDAKRRRSATKSLRGKPRID